MQRHFHRIVCRRNSSFAIKHVPSEILLSKKDSAVVIKFDDCTVRLPSELLRVYSPSADCRMHDGSWNIPPHRRGVVAYQAEVVGNYAVRFIFSDMHDTGIYPYDLLYDLGTRKRHHIKQYLKALKAQGKDRKARVAKQRKKEHD